MTISRRAQSWAVSVVVIVLIFSTASVGAWVLPSRLGDLLRWSVHRAWPEVRLEFGSVEVDGWNRLTARKVELFDRKDGGLLASLERVALSGDWRNLFRWQLDSVELDNPVLYLSPRFLEVFVRQGTPSRGLESERTAREWSIGAVRCDFGEIYVRGFTKEELAVSARFAFDLKDLGIGPERGAIEHQVVFWAVSASTKPDYRAPFSWINLLQIRFQLDHLRQSQTFESIRLEGGHLALGRFLARYFSEEPNADPPDDHPDKRGTGWSVRSLAIEAVDAVIEDDLPELSAIRFSLNTHFRNLSLSSLPEDLGREWQQIELANIEILSPLDPMVRVITLRSVFVRFRIGDLLRNRIGELRILSPSIFVSEDLFAYMQAMKAAYAGPDSAEASQQEKNEPTTSPWRVDRLSVQYGRLVLGGERIGQVGLPLDFQTSVTGVRLDDWAALRMQSQLEVEPRDYDFPPLQLALRELRGNLRFSYPPKESPDNLVNVLLVSKLRWRQYEAGDLWLSATFDSRGINARLGGRAYGGDLSAGVDFFFGPEARWIGWVAGTGIRLEQLTDIMAPQNFRMTGPADLSVQVDAAGSRIDRMSGNLSNHTGGTLRISKIDDLLSALPENWSRLKTSVTTIALETLRDFDYDQAKSEFWFVEGQGKLTLRMNGPAGSRNFDLYLHADESQDALWKKDLTR